MGIHTFLTATALIQIRGKFSSWEDWITLKRQDARVGIHMIRDQAKTKPQFNIKGTREES